MSATLLFLETIVDDIGGGPVIEDCAVEDGADILGGLVWGGAGGRTMGTVVRLLEVKEGFVEQTTVQ